VRWPTAAVVLAVVLVVALVTAWVAGSGSAPGEGTPGSTDATRLGPAPGETVSGYLARSRSVPPGSPGPRPALVTFATAQDPASAAAALAGTGTSAREVVFRVALPRVQTALRRVSLDDSGTVDLTTALRLAETQAANRAGEQARTSQGRPAAVAATESARLGAGCACVVALVVELDPAAVPAVSARPGVRAVEVAPAGARVGALAVSPLLPEQTDDGRDPPETVGPVPDDGPVPPP